MRRARSIDRHPGGRHAVLMLSVALCVAGAAQLAAGALIPAKAVVAQLLLQRAFDRSVATHRPQRPWGWADMAPVARLRVPRLDLDRIVLDSGSGQAMAFGPTVLPGGAAIGGRGTTVIAAHRDTHFRFLAAVVRGDVITLQGVDGRINRYRVTGMAVVRWDRFAITADPAAHGLALSTCYPFGAIGHGPLRYVVQAQWIGTSIAG